MQHFMKKASGVLLGLSLFMGSASADWMLDNEKSALYYASTKEEVVSEINQFKILKGNITEKGLATLEVDLASVATGVDIRDQRMGKYFFELNKFAIATATIDLGEEGIKPGMHDVTAKLSLHGVDKEVAAKVMVMEREDKITVMTVAPIMLSSSDFGLDEGIKMLKKLAALDSINKAVPVTFLLTFNKE